MGQDIRTVAVCTASPALTAILSAVLAAKVGLRVRQFESKAGLTTYMQLAPVALLVCDIEDADMVADLRRDTLADRNLEVIALARAITRKERQQAVVSGIDEVIVKPMSPAYLMERVLDRLVRRSERIAAEENRIERRRSQTAPAAGYRRITDNVVQLFPHSWQPNP